MRVSAISSLLIIKSCDSDRGWAPPDRSVPEPLRRPAPLSALFSRDSNLWIEAQMKSIHAWRSSRERTHKWMDWPSEERTMNWDSRAPFSTVAPLRLMVQLLPRRELLFQSTMIPGVVARKKRRFHRRTRPTQKYRYPAGGTECSFPRILAILLRTRAREADIFCRRALLKLRSLRVGEARNVAPGDAGSDSSSCAPAGAR